MKYDKAIFHLAISLEDNKLKKFLSKGLSDEFDENDTLLNTIYTSFTLNKNKEKKNKIVEKQENNSKNHFSQKIIGILINSRYNKLIHVYYNFFSLIQKINLKALDGFFMNAFYHNINYYHKIIIQYIYLCFVKNDLVKIGESILDYIEFLIKFKFKTSNENEYVLDILRTNIPNMKKIQNKKKIIFNKIIIWFKLFDEYVNHVKNNTSLDDEKNLLDDFTILSSNNTEFNYENQSLFLFKINLQRAEFLKGKFALLCKNNTDALFFFIRAAKKKSIVLDGLIKKKALKRIYKILAYLKKRYNKYDIISWSMKEHFHHFEKSKTRHFNKKLNNNNNNEKEYSKKDNSFKTEMIIIKNDIMNDLEEFNSKQTKDLIILIDFNIYNQEDKINDNTNRINSFIDQTITILDNYLLRNDRLGVFIYKNQHQIICPLTAKSEIDLDSFSKDLYYYKYTLNEIKEDEESSINDVIENDFEKVQLEMHLGNQNKILSSSSSQKSNQSKIKEAENNDNIIAKGLIHSINYCQNYLKLKEDIKNEKFVLLFTNIFNTYKINDVIISSNLEKLKQDKEITFLLAGKNDDKVISNNKNKNLNLLEETNIKEKFLNKYNNKSDVIYYER